MTTILTLILAGIAVSIAVAYKTRLNAGIMTFTVAYIVGCFALGLTPKEVTAFFPSNMIFMLISVSLLNGYAITNGTLHALTRRMMYFSRNTLWAMPWLLWLLAGALTLISQPNAVTIILAPMAFMLAEESGMNPLLAVIAVARGCFLGSNTPMGQGGLVLRGIYESLPDYEATAQQIVNKVYVNSVLTDFIVMAIAYFIFKGYRLKDVNIEKPEKMGRIQKQTCWILVGVLFFVLAPSALYSIWKTPLLKRATKVFEIQMVSIAAALLCGLLKLGDEKKIIREVVPWNTILLIIGICTLTGIAQSIGATEIIGNWIAATFPTLLIPLILVLLAGAMSSFSGAISVVLPTLVPIVPSLADASGFSVTALTSCVFMGSLATTLSPFSSGGSCFLASCPNKELQDSLFYKQLLLAAAIWLVTGLLGMSGLYGII